MHAVTASCHHMLEHDGPVVVPDGSAVRLLNAMLDQHARGRALKSWTPPEVLSWGKLVVRNFELEALRGAGERTLEFVLSPDQERALWEQVIADDRQLDMRGLEQAAPLAMEAWQLQHLWALPVALEAAPVSTDVAAFRRWAAAYRARSADLAVTERVRLLSSQVRRGLAAQQVLAHGFIDPPPLLRRWLPIGESDAGNDSAALAYTGHAYRDRDEELYAALAWAGDVLQRDPGARVVVALESLRQDEALVRRCCRDVFGWHDGAGERHEDWFLSVPSSAATMPTLRFAMLLLELQPNTRWDTLSELIRHPLLAGALAERPQRAAFDAELRALDRYDMPLKFVLNQIAEQDGCARLAGILSALDAAHGDLPRRARLATWVQHFESCLSIGGWPGEGDIEAPRMASLKAWSEACDRLAALDAVLAPVSRGEALARLRRFIGEANIKPAVAANCVFVVRPDEALLLDPTHLWLAGCEADSWPARARLSALLPLADQRRAALPGALPERDLLRARTLLGALGSTLSEGHASYARGDGELRYTPSPLLPALAQAALAETPPGAPFGWRQARAILEPWTDTQGAALADSEALRGGVGVFAAQSACAFRGYARHRLAARAVDEPLPGMSARHKGIIVHRVLAIIWQQLGERAALAALDESARGELVRKAIQQALTPLSFATPVEREIFLVERERLLALIERWLEFELEREAFSVIAAEQPAEVEFGGLNFATRIDRVDRLPDGRAVVVDYKTGRCSLKDWDTPRMVEPQLPLYALTAAYADIAGIAFARVERKRPQWLQVPARNDHADDAWTQARVAWRADLDALAEDIRNGRAAVAPKRGLHTCRYCEQQLFCRRLELDLDGEASDDDPDDAFSAVVSEHD